ncbi:IclR family transcriptional regulator [Hwanghaeella sp.]|uniref:IclR family transcriptional regulator n=1 Tax=Hwanghaeella sp. TaxID=2605943 RepID=UPI003CCBC20C
MAPTTTKAKQGTAAKSKKASAERDGIQSIKRASALLDAVAAAGPSGIGLGELSEKVGLHTSTTFHLVKTLESVGFLMRQDEGKRYRIGNRLFVLAAGALDETALLALGMPILERLSKETGEAAHLAVRSNADIVLVGRTAATGMLQMSERAGVVRPAHATAIGKLLLAQCSEEDLDWILDAVDFAPFTENTITNAKTLRKELKTIRETDIAYDRQELDSDVRCVAVPVLDFAGRCVAAMGISGPVWRMGEEEAAVKTDALRKAANALSTALGNSNAGVD